jgi:uncharacterized protein (UPF0335 family)
MPLSENTPIRLPLRTVVPVIVAIVSLGGAVAVAAYQIRDHTIRVERLETNSQEHDRRIQRTEDLGTEVREQLRDLRQDVKELLRRNDR